MDARRARILKIKEAYSSAWAAVEKVQEKSWDSSCEEDFSTDEELSEESASCSTVSKESVGRLRDMYRVINSQVREEQRECEEVEAVEKLALTPVNLQLLLQDPQWLL